MAIEIGRCRLKTILRAKYMTQTHLAHLVDSSPQRISDYANDRVTMSLLVAVRIADVLHVSVIDLYEWKR